MPLNIVAKSSIQLLLMIRGNLFASGSSAKFNLYFANCNRVAAIFNGIGNKIVPTGDSEVVNNSYDLVRDIDPKELVAAAIRSLSDREVLKGSQKGPSRFLLFNAAANLALANWQMESVNCILTDGQGSALKVERSDEFLLSDQFKSLRGASLIIDQFLELDLPFQGIVGVEVYGQTIAGAAQVHQ